ncbi:MAG: signal peptidase II, partial [Clostridia bacterium]|nr:signal peptidase II [Clostridia bacterium]
GNMIDRVAMGSVVDFIELPFLWLPVLNMYFPIFNVADSFVTVGVVILIVCLIRLQVLEWRAAKQENRENRDGGENDHGSDD